MENQSVYIGLGGAGVYSTSHLKAKLLAHYGYDREALRRNCRFLFIDTDRSAIDEMNSAYLNVCNGEDLITEDELVSLFDTNTARIYQEARSAEKNSNASDPQKHLLGFVDDKSARGFQNRYLERGAGANRQQGRVAIWTKWPELGNKIAKIINDLKNPLYQTANSRSIAFYLLSGTCGGTGSSMFLDVAYLLNRSVIGQFNDREPSVRAVLFMPEWYIQQYNNGEGEATVRRYQCNAYAFFEEVNYFLYDYHGNNDGDRGKIFSKVFIAPTVDAPTEEAMKSWNVFDFAILIDSTSEHERKLNDQQMYQNTAEMLYYWNQPAIHGAFLSIFDNQFLSSYEGNARVPAFITMGYRALQFPSDIQEEYGLTRFLKEFFTYGLIGEGSENFLNSQPGKKLLEGFVEHEVSRRLTSDAAIGNATGNLARAGLKHLATEQDLLPDLSNFEMQAGARKESKGWLASLLSPRKDEDEDESSYDPRAIGDKIKLNKLRDSYTDAIKKLEHKLTASFNNSSEPTSKEQITTDIKEAVETFLENSIYAFGLKGAQKLAQSLISSLNALADDIQKYRDPLALAQLDKKISDALDRCVNRRLEGDLINYRELLNDYLESSFRKIIAEQQIQILEGLTAPHADLQSCVNNLERMRNYAQNRVSGANLEPGMIGLDEQFKRFPARIQLLQRDVTKTYLPEVQGIINNGEGDSDHPFVRLYETIVPRQIDPKTGNPQPLRHSGAADLFSNPVGLHEIFEKMVRESNDEGSGKGYLQNGELVFFRRYFKGGLNHEFKRMLQEIENMASATFKRKLSETNLNNETSGLQHAFQSLTAEQKQRLRQDFVGNTELFCKVENSTGSYHPSFGLYVGSDEALARTLGYEVGSGDQFIQTEDTSRFLHIKVKTHFTINQYPYFERYRNIYHQELERSRNGSNRPFSPHIHKLFNQFGITTGMRRLSNPTDTSKIFAAALIYNEMFALAKESVERLLKEVIHLDQKQGDEKTKFSLFLSKEEPARNAANGVWVCARVEHHEGKLCMRKKHFVELAGEARNWRDVFDRLDADTHDIQGELQKIDEFFLGNCTSEWATRGGAANEMLLGTAYKNICGQIETELNADDLSSSEKDWYFALSNILEDEYKRLDTSIRKRPDSSLFKSS